METSVFFGDDTNLTGEVIRDGVILQSFTAKHEKLVCVGVNFATYKRKTNFSMIICDLLDEEANVISKNVVNAKKIIDNRYYEFFIGKKLNVGEKYFLKIYSKNGIIGHSVTAKWGYRRNMDDVLYINDTIKRGELCCYFTYEDGRNLSNRDINRFNQGLVSLVITNYNTTNYLRLLLNSIKQQRYNNIEVIVVDDFSKDVDQVEKLVSSYTDCLSIKFVKRDTNGGACVARNNGFEFANGEFLMFCDSDVILHKNAIEEMVQTFHENKNISWVYCDFHVGSEKRVFQKFSLDRLKKVNLCSTMSMMRKNLFPKFNVKLKRLQDWDLFLRMAKKGYVGKWINKFLFFAADRKDGITRGGISWEQAIADLKKHHKDLVKNAC